MNREFLKSLELTDEQIEENDIALMDSMILAHWACAEAKESKKQKIRY